jgi:hypothetical protein
LVALFSSLDPDFPATLRTFQAPGEVGINYLSRKESLSLADPHRNVISFVNLDVSSFSRSSAAFGHLLAVRGSPVSPESLLLCLVSQKVLHLL